MSQKQTKKLRQLMRKQYNKDIREMAEINSKFLKQKPRIVPMRIWVGLLKMFIYIK